MTGTQGMRIKQLLKDLEEKRVYCKLKEEALAHPSWRTGFRRGYSPFVRQSRL